MGASPDGLVCYDGQVRGCVEIKCPYSARDKSVVDACSMPQFYCNKDENDKITLKQTSQLLLSNSGPVSNSQS